MLHTSMIFGALMLAMTDVLCAGSGAAGDLEKNFIMPPAESKPWIWWHWLDGNINKTEITADLEAMHQVGIGGVIIVTLDVGLPKGPVKAPEYGELIRFAVAEAGRLGLKVGKNPGDGYSTGGPWITPELAMQRVVYSEVQCEGGRPIDQIISQPPAQDNYYRDIALWAYPSLEGEGVQITNFNPTVTTSVSGIDLQSLFNFNWYAGYNAWCFKDLGVKFGVATPAKPVLINLIFEKPYRARSFTLGLCNPSDAEGLLESSSDGDAFLPIVKFKVSATGRRTFVFPEVCARFYRLRFTSGDIGVSGLELSPRLALEGWAGKSQTLEGLVQDPVVNPSAAISSADCVNRADLIDLSSKMTADGRLSWDAPAGRWTILRIGATGTGMNNVHAGPGGRGLECDHLSAEATDTQWREYVEKLLADLGPLVGTVFKNLFFDSYENGYQNWTPRLVEEFKVRRGYDPRPFLLVLCNRFVESKEATGRFLWDFRQTIAELWSENFTGRYTALCHQRGLTFSIEPYGGGIVDNITYGAPADMPLTEFWIDRGCNAGQQVSIGHVYGHRLIGAEAFTSLPEAEPLIYPYKLKQEGDMAFVQGINHFEIHNFVHQPWPNRSPGIKFGGYGMNFGRTTTWWNQSEDWLRYVARCQYLLRQGLAVADVVGYEKRDLPLGYSFDLCNYHAIQTRMSACDGKIVLPDGMSYRLLTLDDTGAMTPALLKSVSEMIKAGATVVGPKPTHSPSLQDFPRADAEIVALADEVWGDCDGKSITEHAYGKGRIIWGKPLGEILKQAGVIPDFAFRPTIAGTRLFFNHRRVDDTDIYFIANRSEKSGAAVCTFRVRGKVPELWHPDTGVIEGQPLYDTGTDDGGTVLPLQFDPFGSLFVVFRSPATAPAQRVASVSREGVRVASVASANTVKLRQADAGKLVVTVKEPGSYTLTMADGSAQTFSAAPRPGDQELSGPWALSFPPSWGAPAKVMLDKLCSWSEHSDAGVRYFSGTASYQRQIEISPTAIGKGQRIILELGRVKNLAQVLVNGQDCGVLWKEPFSVDITTSARQGKNDLEIRVTNLWPNRMIGDEQLPSDPLRSGSRWKAWPQWLLAAQPDPNGALTFSSYMPFTKDSPLLESGLLGPVWLTTAEEITLDLQKVDLRVFLEKEIASGKKRIVIPPGRYLLLPKSGPFLMFRNLSDIEIVAKGVEMICGATLQAIGFDNCTNVTLRGLTVDYDPLPFTQGFITALAPDKSWAEFEVAEGYPENMLHTRERIEIYESATRELRCGDLPWGPTTVSLGGHRYRVSKREGYRFDPHRDTEQVGDILVTDNSFPAGAGGYGVVANRCAGLRLEKITLYATPGCGFLESECSGNVYLHCRIDRRPPGEDPVKRALPRLRSINADAFHSVGAVKGPAIVGCKAHFQGDDCVNIHGTSYSVTACDGNRLRVAAHAPMAIQADDPVEFLPFAGHRPPDAVALGIERDLAPLTEADREFFNEINVNPYVKQIMLSGKGAFYTLTLDRAVALPPGSQISSANRIGNGFVIQDCDFGFNRSRGILVKASHGKVLRNTITRSWMAAILVSPEFWWNESGTSSDVEIRGNTIIGCRRTAIEVVAYGGDGKPLTAGAHRNIAIVGNRLKQCPWPLIHVTSTDGLILDKNSWDAAPAPGVLAGREGKPLLPIVLELCEPAEGRP